MGTPADTLVSKHPTRVKQLQGPVYDYLKMISKKLPFNGTDQDLYMAVFYPAYRRKPVNALLPGDVRKYNPGINTAGDYIAKVNAQKSYPTLSPQEWSALKETAANLGIKWETLYKMIMFESKWDAKARNPSSGARGLIQFMPATAAGMGYKGGIGIGTIVLVLGAAYLVVKAMG